MRTLNYKILLALMAIALLFSSSYGQHENDTWAFGQNKWVINANGFTNSQLGYYNKYVTASISDKNTGQLLFYSNGISIFDRNGNLMQNGNNLQGDPNNDPNLQAFYDSAAFCGGNMTYQGVMILPKPNSNNHYYVFSNVNSNYIDCPYNGNNYRDFGLRYAEIDMTSGLGNVISKNNIISTTPTTGLTSAASNNGTFFWLITSKNGNFYSYKVNSNGIQLNNPVISTGPGTNKAGPIKISPNGQFLINYRTNGIAGADYILYNFNNSTGQISNPIDILASAPPFHNYSDQSINLNSLEFSPNSNIIYFIGSYATSGTSGPYILASGLCMYNISTGQLYGANSSGYDFPLLSDYMSANLQLAINNKIYLILNYQSDNGNYVDVSFGYQNYPNPYESDDWGVINYPDVWNTSNNPISYINAPLGVKNGYVFPNLIPGLPQCVNDITITEDVLSGENDIQSALNTITATNIIYSGGSAAYDAGVTVFLKPGFNAKSGSDFRAFIQGCTVPPIVNEDGLIKNNEDFDSQKEKILVLHPIPTSGLLNMTSKENMYRWEISNPFGIIQRSGTFKMTNARSLEIDLSNLITGIYYIKVVFQDGEITTKTIIKE